MWKSCNDSFISRCKKRRVLEDLKRQSQEPKRYQKLTILYLRDLLYYLSITAVMRYVVLQNICGHQQICGPTHQSVSWLWLQRTQLSSPGFSSRFSVVFQSTPNVSTFSLNQQLLEAYSFCDRSQEQCELVKLHKCISSCVHTTFTDISAKACDGAKSVFMGGKEKERKKYSSLTQAEGAAKIIKISDRGWGRS